MFEKIVKKKLLRTLQAIQYGELMLTTPEGEQFSFKGNSAGKSVHLILKDWRVILNLQRKGDVGFAEDYRDGCWSTPNLVDLLYFGLENEQMFTSYRGKFLYNQWSKLAYWMRRNTRQQSKKNIHAHYDLGNAFYQLWLDASMTYSSADYRHPEETLQQAQQNKYERILQRLSPYSVILEIGCGWGGFAEKALQTGQHTLKAITLSEQQQQYTAQRLAPYGAAAQVVLEDYRDQTGQYDAIVSIEMLEAVGEKYWPLYFKTLKSLLKPTGKIILQSIVIADDLFAQYAKGTDVIRTHIFPGGMLPSRKILEQQLAQQQLRCQHDYFFGLSYAQTLTQWLENFTQQQEKLVALGFDLRFQRLWHFYLASCIAAFQKQRIDVVQLEITHA